MQEVRVTWQTGASKMSLSLGKDPCPLPVRLQENQRPRPMGRTTGTVMAPRLSRGPSTAGLSCSRLLAGRGQDFSRLCLCVCVSVLCVCVRERKRIKLDRVPQLGPGVQIPDVALQAGAQVLSPALSSPGISGSVRTWLGGGTTNQVVWAPSCP